MDSVAFWLAPVVGYFAAAVALGKWLKWNRVRHEGRAKERK